MYSPTFFTSDSFSLWNPTTYSSNKRSNDIEETKRAPHLFAPPMQAYSCDLPGAYINELEYTIQVMTAKRSSIRVVTPLVQRKLDQLENIRKFGYGLIRPPGINKTMEQIEFEQMKRNNTSEVDEGSYHTIENTNNTINSRTVVDQDLDAHIENLDIVNSSEDMNDSMNLNISNSNHNNPSNNILSDDGFMADDVEYQIDHSLNRQIDSVVASPIFTSNMRSATTNQTTIPSATSPAEVSILPNANDENENHENETHDANENDDMDMTMD